MPGRPSPSNPPSRPCPDARRKQVRTGEPVNLDQLPPTGAILITAPLKIENGRAARCACWRSSPKRR